VERRQMYYGGSAVGKALAVGIPPSLIFTGGGGQKVRNLASFNTSLNFERPRLKMH